MQWQTTVTERGQTSIPIQIRRRYNLKSSTRLIWLDLGKTISIVPLSEDPVKTLRGFFRERGLTQILLNERRRQRELERKLK